MHNNLQKKNLQHIWPSSTDTGFCCGSALVSLLFLFCFCFYLFEVVVLQCAYSYSKITLHHSFLGLLHTGGVLQRDPLRNSSIHPHVSHTITHAGVLSPSRRVNQLVVSHIDSSLLRGVSHLSYSLSTAL